MRFGEIYIQTQDLNATDPLYIYRLLPMIALFFWFFFFFLCVNGIRIFYSITNKSLLIWLIETH